MAKNPRGGDGEVRCELDVDHGWAARRVELTGHCIWEVKKFMLVDGRWFPAEGRVTVLDLPNTSTDFKVSRWHVNRSIPAAKFDLPELPKGVRVFDHGQLIDGRGEHRRDAEAERLTIRLSPLSDAVQCHRAEGRSQQRLLRRSAAAGQSIESWHDRA